MARVNLVRSRASDSAVFKIAHTLSKGGYEVNLLIWDRSGRRVQEPNHQYTVYSFGLRAPVDKVEGVPFLPLFWLYEILFLVKHRAHVYHACDFDTLFPALVAARITGAKIFYSILDFYANNIPKDSLGRAGKLIHQVVEALEKACIGFADVVAIADDSRRAEIQGARTKKVIVLYNSPEDIWKEEPLVPKRELQKLVIFYAGLLIKDIRGIDQMIEAVRRVDDITLVLAGSGPDESYFRELAQQTSRLQFRGWIPRHEDLLRAEMNSDVLFRFSDPKHPKSRYESPNKLFDAMMCAKPIIVSDGGSMARIVKEETCGLVVPFGDISAIRQAITRLRDDADLCFRLGSNGRGAYEHKYSGNIMRGRLLRAYGDLVLEMDMSTQG
jgi:glycosyltransferase involved in cell wall biosynthesis